AHQFGEDLPGQTGTALTPRTVGQGCVEELGEMLGERAGGVHEVEDQGREQLPQRHARSAPAPLGQRRLDQAEALPECSMKTLRGKRRATVAPHRNLFFMPRLIRQGRTFTGEGLNYRKALPLSGYLDVLDSPSGGWASAVITAPNVFSAPVVSRTGILYFGTGLGQLYAYAGAHPLSSGPWPMFGHDTMHSGRAPERSISLQHDSSGNLEISSTV